MKLNQNGWGVMEMLVLVGVLALFLLLTIYLITSFANAFYKEAKTTDYSKLEKKLENQTLIYLNDYYKGMLTSEGMIVTKEVLINNGLDGEIIDNGGFYCDGYAFATKSRGIIVIKPYVSCRNYETDGYEEVIGNAQ